MSKQKKSRIELFALIGLPTLVAAIVLVLIGNIVYATYTMVAGTELNVTTWQVRRFSFRAGIYNGEQITGVSHTTTTSIDSSITQYLSGGPADPGSRWDLVSISGRAGSRSAGAEVFLNYVESHSSSGDLVWEKWSKDHPSEAPVFWGAVRDLVHLEMYRFLPRVFTIAQGVSTSADFTAEINSVMLELTHAEALASEKAGESEQAALIATVGLTYGTDAELQRLAR